MDFMDKMKEKVKKKIAIYAALIIVPFFFLMMFMIVVVELVIGSSNNNQSTGENAYIKEGETGENAVFKVLCQNCDISGSEKSGIMGTEFMEKMSEMINLYNKLELETERIDELDFILLSTTIGYGKKMQAEIFSDSEKFGWWVEEESLTNRDINQFARESDITLENAQKFYKWASVSLGTPYALPNLNLRGLSGNLVSGKIVTTCDKGSDSLADLIKEIVKIERKLSGEEDTEPSFWDNILSIFGVKYSTDDKVLIERLTKAFDEIDNPDSDYADLLVYLGLDNYEPDMQCPSGKPRYTYTKFMNYEQYKVYLEKVYVPETYINCDECLYKNSSDYNKSVLAKRITREIFELAEYNRSYLGMNKIDYISLLYGEGTEVGDLKYFSSPIKSLCSIPTGGGFDDIRGKEKHNAIDVNTSGDTSMYSIYDGIVHNVEEHTTKNLYDPKTYTSYCPNPLNPDEPDPKSNGVELVIKHEINGKIYYARYLHLEPNSITVKVGQRVKKGDKVANMGNTGCSTGQHLHFDLRDETGTFINPAYLFKQCANAEIEGKVKVTTTDNFVTPKKCMVGNLSLDEVITGLIKKDYSGAASNPEYVKSLAIVIRTKLMHETDWCNKKINAKVDVDIESNQNDLQIYGYVLDTQGMVLNYSGELIENADYARFPCQWFNPNNWRYTNNTSDLRANFGDIFSKTNEEGAEIINKHNSKGCVNYVNKGGDTISVEFDTIPKDVKGKEDSEKITYNKVTVEISKPSPPAQDGGAQKKFSTLAARAYGKEYDYTWILNKFYAAKTISKNDPNKYMGLVDISTSPGLIDAKLSLLSKLEEKKES